MTAVDTFAWQADALCSDLDPAVFFSAEPERVTEAKAICLLCPAIDACAEWGILHEEFGVWGGLDAADRKRIRQIRGQLLRPPEVSPARPAAACGTRSGYHRHRREGTVPCDECRTANADAESARAKAARS